MSALAIILFVLIGFCVFGLAIGVPERPFNELDWFIDGEWNE